MQVNSDNLFISTYNNCCLIFFCCSFSLHYYTSLFFLSLCTFSLLPFFLSKLSYLFFFYLDLYLCCWIHSLPPLSAFAILPDNIQAVRLYLHLVLNRHLFSNSDINLFQTIVVSNNIHFICSIDHCFR